MIRFTKMHGAGNDYIYVNTMLYDIPRPEMAAIAWSDRHKGIGSDGLVLIGAATTADADFSMRIFNADGSEAMMCGNASRCIGKYLYERGLTQKTTIRLQTLSGIKTLLFNTTDDKVESVTVDMLEPVLENMEQYVPSLRVWERGSGITMACGTGACATAVAAAVTGRASRQSAIVMDGGTLDIEWNAANNHVYMTGPAEFVFDGEISDEL